MLAALPLLDVIATLGGLIVPPAFDFIKKKFVKAENDTPERTISNLATTSPENLPQYVTALTGYKESLVKFFNRDVIGTPSQWVIDLRAAIRPMGVVSAFLILGYMGYSAMAGGEIPGDPSTVMGIRVSCETMISSWFGHRLTIQNN